MESVSSFQLMDIMNVLWLVFPLVLHILFLIFVIRGYNVAKSKGWGFMVVAGSVTLFGFLLNKLMHFFGSTGIIGGSLAFYEFISIMDFVLYILQATFVVIGVYWLFKREAQFRNQQQFPPRG